MSLILQERSNYYYTMVVYTYLSKVFIKIKCLDKNKE